MAESRGLGDVYKRQIEKTLAKDYYRSYRSTYRIIVISMVLSAFVLTTVLVSQSYRTLNEKYNSYKSPYNFNSSIYTDDFLDKNFVNDMEKVKGIEQLHIYQRVDTKFYTGENEDFISKDLKNSLDSGKKSGDKLYASIYAPVSYTHLTLPTTARRCRSRWSPYH